jgi:hypothetical protein
VEPAVKVLGPIRDERAPEPPDADAAVAPEPAVEPSAADVPAALQAPRPLPLIDDATVSGPVSWDPADAERKPLLTRAQPLDSRGPAAVWALRILALVLLVAIVVAVLALLV